MCNYGATESKVQPPKTPPLNHNDVPHFNASAPVEILYPSSFTELVLYCYCFFALFAQRSRFSSDFLDCTEIVFQFKKLAALV